MIRLLKLLGWFIIPIVLLHGLLSPGQLLIPDFFISLSREGLMQGLRLSLHLGALFFTAILMFRLLKRNEWLHYMMMLPWLGKRLLIYVWMMHGMAMNITLLLADLRDQFRLRKDVKKIPLLLMAAFRMTWVNASEHAYLLWLRWPERMPALTSISHPKHSHCMQYQMTSVLLAGIGCCAFVLAYLWV